MSGPVHIDYSAPTISRGLAARLAANYQLWRQRRRWIAELANVAALERFDDALNDIGLTRGELAQLTEGPADAGRQFEDLAERARIDLHHLAPEVQREAMWTCAHCAGRTACKRWLRTGVWRGDGDMRCPNAALFSH